MDDVPRTPENRQSGDPTQSTQRTQDIPSAQDQSYTDKIPQAATEAPVQDDLGKSLGIGRGKMPVAIIGVIVLLAIIAVIAIVLYGKAPTSGSTSVPTTVSAVSTVLSTVPANTTVPQSQIGMAQVNSLVANFAPNITIKNGTSSGLGKNVVDSNVTSFTNIYATSSFQNGNVINYSSLNQSEPLAIYLTVYYINSSDVRNYTERFYSDNGLGNNYPFGVIKSNSSFRAYPTSFFEGANGLLDELSNFTSDGLNLSGVYYSGKKPDVSWYFTSAIYKNTRIDVGEWGFAGRMNKNLLIDYTNSVIGGLSKNSASSR